jgi:hypothetical protein
MSGGAPRPTFPPVARSQLKVLFQRGESMFRMMTSFHSRSCLRSSQLTLSELKNRCPRGGHCPATN